MEIVDWLAGLNLIIQMKFQVIEGQAPLRIALPPPCKQALLKNAYIWWLQDNVNALNTPDS